MCWSHAARPSVRYNCTDRTGTADKALGRKCHLRQATHGARPQGVARGAAQSHGEAHSQGVEKGRIECKQEGVKEDIREAASEFAQQPIQDGVPGQIFTNIRSCR